MQIPLSQDVPEPIRALVGERIEPFLRDVHVMLRFPTRGGGGDEPGFNFSIASALFSVIGGFSRVFFSAIKDDKASFCTAAEKYPLREEPWTDYHNDRSLFSIELYKSYRCNLVHSLGLTTEWSNTAKRHEVVTHGTYRKVTRQRELPRTEQQLAELDIVLQRPDWLGPTLSAADGAIRLNADALYWGVRRLTRDLAEDRSLRADAGQFVLPWFRTRQTHSSTGPMTVTADWK